MGIAYSCPFADFDDLDESYLVGSLSFNGRDSFKIDRLKSFGSGKMILQGSLSFRGRRDLEAKISLQPPAEDHTMVRSVSFLLDSGDDRQHQAALKLQKTYKSFRTRRQLADCAVLVEQRWWKLLDFAELKRSSISFFEIEKPETAVSRWSRARTRAAKVGKGLSKDERARKLALQHWLEAIDPRHRYGHNLQFYYVNWLQCDSRQPFFYWLDVGEGWNVNLERCPRSKLQQQCIKYLGPLPTPIQFLGHRPRIRQHVSIQPMKSCAYNPYDFEYDDRFFNGYISKLQGTERSGYEVMIKDGKFTYKQSGELLDTRQGPEDVKWIFVLSASKILYVGQKKKGKFQHSSFLAGGATLSAGRLIVEDGVLKAVWPHSGHYLPTEENFEEFMAFLTEHNVDLSVVQRAPDNEEEEAGFQLRSTKSVPELMAPRNDMMDSKERRSHDAENTSRWSRKLHSKIALLQIPVREDMREVFSTPKPSLDSPMDDGYETADEYLSDTDFEVSKQNLFDKNEEEEYQEPIPKEKIIKRINSHKGMKSYQLANQLSCKWASGAGPRIGCVRDYPSELQVRVLEEVSLSPRGKPPNWSLQTPRRERSSLGAPLPKPEP